MTRIKEWMLEVNFVFIRARLWIDASKWEARDLDRLKHQVYEVLEKQSMNEVGFQGALAYCEEVEKLFIPKTGLNAVEIIHSQSGDGALLYPEWP